MEESKKNIFTPSLSMVLALISAITCSYWYYLGERTDLIASIFFCLAFMLSIFFMFKKEKGTKKKSIHRSRQKRIIKTAVFITTLTILFTIVLYKISGYSGINAEELAISPPLNAKVTGITERRYNKEIILEGNDENAKIPGTIIAYSDKGADILSGDKIEITSDFQRIEVKPGKYREYSLSRIRQGAGYITYLRDDNFRILQRENPGVKAVIRKWMTDNTNHLFNEETSAVLRALYFGNKSHISRRTLLSYKRAGVLHVLAASGLHVGILALIPFAVLGLFRINRKFLMAITLFILTIYLFITDMPVSLQRAVIMFGIFSIQYILDMEKNIFNTLFLAAIGVLLIHPYEIYSLGFQLSFGATTGILLFHRKCSDTLSFLPKKLKGPLSITLAAQIIVIPLILYHMGELNIAGFLSNIIVIPLTALMLITSILAHAISPISDFLSQYSAQAVNMIQGLCCYIIEIISGLNLHFRVSVTDFRLILPFLLLLAPLYPFLKKKKAAAAMVGSSILLFTIFFKMDTPTENLIVMNHSSGCILVNIKPQYAAIIGTIPNNNVADPITDTLEKYNIRNAVIFIPEPDYSNIRGFLRIIKKTDVDQCILGDTFYFTGYMKQFFSVLEQDKIELKIRHFPQRKINKKEFKKIIDQKSNINIMSLYLSLKNRANKDIKNIAGLSGVTIKEI